MRVDFRFNGADDTWFHRFSRIEMIQGKPCIATNIRQLLSDEMFKLSVLF